jgi:hypothetical protein
MHKTRQANRADEIFFPAKSEKRIALSESEPCKLVHRAGEAEGAGFEGERVGSGLRGGRGPRRDPHVA